MLKDEIEITELVDMTGGVTQAKLDALLSELKVVKDDYMYLSLIDLSRIDVDELSPQGRLLYYDLFGLVMDQVPVDEMFIMCQESRKNYRVVKIVPSEEKVYVSDLDSKYIGDVICKD